MLTVLNNVFMLLFSKKKKKKKVSSANKWHWELGEFSLKHSKVWKIVLFMGFFCPKHWKLKLQKEKLQLENYTEIICHNSETLCKIYRKTDLWLEKWHLRDLVNFHVRSGKSEIYTSTGPFCSKHVKLLKSTKELCLMTLESDPKKS